MRRLLKWILLAALLLAIGGAVYLGPRIRRLSNIGAGYIAKQMCSCIFVSERTFDSCRQDMPTDMARVQATPLGGGGGVRAWVTGLAERTARIVAESK